MTVWDILDIVNVQLYANVILVVDVGIVHAHLCVSV